jgi:hypothetical protein
MRKLALSLIVAFAFYVTAAAAQAGGGTAPGPQGTQGSSPSMQQPGATQPGAAQPGQSPNMGPGANDQTGATTNTNSNKDEKKLKGCVESQNGQYVLMTKKGNVALAGQDVSAHVGHEVSVKGTWDNSGSNNANASPTASSSGEASSKGTFNVAEVKMESEQCKIKSKDHSGSMSGSSTGTTGGSTGTGSDNSGTGSSGSTSGTGTGSSTGSGTGSNTAPPQ